jgi:hypothetical protein
MAFLETTVVANRIFGTPGLRERIEAACADTGQHVSSDYVLAELKRTLLYDCAVLHALLVTYSDPSEAMEQLLRLKASDLRRLYPWFSRRSLESTPIRAFQIAVSLGLATPRWRRDKALIRLHRLLTGELTLEFQALVAHVIPGTACPIALRDAAERGPVFEVEVRCQRGKTGCGVPAFWREHQDELRTMCEALADTKDAKLRQMRRIGERVLSEAHPHDGSGRRTCWAIGDMVIAAQCPQDVPICTTNLGHFQPLCVSLNKMCFSYDPQLSLKDQ